GRSTWKAGAIAPRPPGDAAPRACQHPCRSGLGGRAAYRRQRARAAALVTATLAGAVPARRRRRLAAFHDGVDLRRVDGLVLQQQLGHRVQLVDVLGEDGLGAVVRAVQDPVHDLVDLARGLVGHALVLGHRTAEEHLVLLLAIGDRTEFVGKAPLGDHVARHLGGPLDVVGRAGGDLVHAEDQLLGHAPAVQGRQAAVQALAGGTVTVALGQELGHAQRPATRNDGDLVDRVVVRHQAADDGVAGLVVGGVGLLFLAHGHRAALGTHQDLVAGTVEVVHPDLLLV